MKKLIIYLIVLIFCQCQGQKKTTYNTAYIKIIDSSFEKLNINNPTLLKTKLRYGTKEPPAITVNLDENSQNGTLIKTYGLLGTYYDQWITPSKGWFEVDKEFYADGNIKVKRIYNKTSPGDYGKLYEFDKTGKLIKLIDFENDWKTSFSTITEIADKYAKKLNYKLDASANGSILSKNEQQWDKEYVKIWRKDYEGGKYWFIGFNKRHYENPDDKKVERIVVLIDDNNGKEIKNLNYFDFYNALFKEPLEKK